MTSGCAILILLPLVCAILGASYAKAHGVSVVLGVIYGLLAGIAAWLIGVFVMEGIDRLCHRVQRRRLMLKRAVTPSCLLLLEVHCYDEVSHTPLKDDEMQATVWVLPANRAKDLTEREMDELTGKPDGGLADLPDAVCVAKRLPKARAEALLESMKAAMATAKVPILTESVIDD